MPKVFERCPKCNKKGFHMAFGYIGAVYGVGTKRCRYCSHIVVPPTSAGSQNPPVTSS